MKKSYYKSIVNIQANNITAMDNLLCEIHTSAVQGLNDRMSEALEEIVEMTKEYNDDCDD